MSSSLIDNFRIETATQTKISNSLFSLTHVLKAHDVINMQSHYALIFEENKGEKRKEEKKEKKSF